VPDVTLHPARIMSSGPSAYAGQDSLTMTMGAADSEALRKRIEPAPLAILPAKPGPHDVGIKRLAFVLHHLVVERAVWLLIDVHDRGP